MKKLEVLVMGAGAVGVNLAEQLLHSKLAGVRFLANASRAAKLNSEGVLLNDTLLNLRCVTPEELEKAPDLIILTVKAGQLQDALSEMAPAVGESTQILSLLNGIESEELIAQQFGWHRTLYGYVVGIDATRRGNHTRGEVRGTYYFGRRENSTLAPEVQMVHDLFESAGLAFEVPEDMRHSLWWKFMVNVGINPVSAILRAPYGVFQHSKFARQLMSDSIKEVRQIAAKEGVTLSPADVEKWYGILAGLDPSGETSMLQDVLAARQTEVSIFCDVVTKLGRQHGVATPLNATMSLMLHSIDEQNRDS